MSFLAFIHMACLILAAIDIIWSALGRPNTLGRIIGIGLTGLFISEKGINNAMILRLVDGIIRALQTTVFYNSVNIIFDLEL